MKRTLSIFLVSVLLLGGCTVEEDMKESNPGNLNLVLPEPVTTVSFAFTGDLLFEQGLYNSQDNYQFGNYFDEVKPYLKADFVIGNQEVPIGGKELGVCGVAYQFNAPEEVAMQLPEVGFNVMTHSTNHTYDRGVQGVVNTIHYLKDNGITPIGMYETREDSEKIQIIEKNGMKIAILAYTYDTNIGISNDNRYVVKTFLNDSLVFDEEHKEMLRKDVEQAKKEADVVIAAMHWGREFTYELNYAQKEVAPYLNELGVDLIIGNHPHTLQTMDILTNSKGKDTVVFYSLGNFVSSAAMVSRSSVHFANMYEIGGIVNLDIQLNLKTKEVKIENMVLTPIVNHFEHNYTNFKLIPLSKYTNELASKHYQREYSSDFNLEWIQRQIDYLFKDKIEMN